MVVVTPWIRKTPPKGKEILDYFKKESLKPHTWTNAPGYEYTVHSHKYAKVLFCLKGSIVFRTHPDGRTYALKPGDQLIVPAGIIHSALVGSEGVTCIEAPQYAKKR